MKKLNDKKISVLAATALTVSLVMPTVQMIPAEETEVLDQYMIIELEPLAKLEVDVQQTENSSEEQSTEEFSEVVSDSDTVLFRLPCMILFRISSQLIRCMTLICRYQKMPMLHYIRQ